MYKFKDIKNILAENDIKMHYSNWQHLVNEYNKSFYENRENAKFIAHSNKGYILTDDKEIIKQSLDNYRDRAIPMLQHCYRGYKTIGKLTNIDLFEIVSEIERDI